MKNRVFNSLLAVAFLSPISAIAANSNYLKDAPYAHFSAEDKKMFHQILDETMDKGADGVARTWDNPATQAGGEIKPLKAVKRGGAVCRSVSIKNRAKSRSAQGKYTLCKDASGKWALAE